MGVCGFVVARKMSDSHIRFRASMLAVRLIHRFVTHTLGISLEPSRIEKRFHVGISGVNIAPLPCTVDVKKTP